MPESELYSTTRFEGSHRHEVFFGTGNRQKSIKLGLVVFLTPEMHNMSNYGVHFNKAFDYELKQIVNVQQWKNTIGRLTISAESSEEIIYKRRKNNGRVFKRLQSI